MSSSTPLTTPSDLPYAVRQPKVLPLFSSEADVTLQLWLRGGERIDDDVIANGGSLLVVFYELALSGALSGSQIEPWSSSIGDFEESIFESSISWTLKKCRVDESCMVMLARSFLLVHERFAIEKLVFSPAGQGCNYIELASNAQKEDAYPGVYMPLEFRVVNNLFSSSGAEITIDFESELSAEEMDGVDVEISSWLAAGEVGMYTLPPLSPADCTFTFNDDLFFDGSKLEFSLSRFRAHPAAINGLINLCSAMNRRVARVKRVLIE